MNISVELLPGGRLPCRALETDAAYDCYARTVEEEAGLVVCRLGFRLEVPTGWFADLRPRSGIFRTGLTLSNSCGIVDAGYRGEVRAVFYRICPGELLAPGDRVVQMMIRRLDPVELVVVPQVQMDTPRGEGGFGSTGK